jgi:hypothetical protein
VPPAEGKWSGMERKESQAPTAGAYDARRQSFFSGCFARCGLAGRAPPRQTRLVQHYFFSSGFFSSGLASAGLVAGAMWAMPAVERTMFRIIAVAVPGS